MNPPTAPRGRHLEGGLLLGNSCGTASNFLGSASGVHFINSVYGAANVPPLDHHLHPGEETHESGDTGSPQRNPLWQPNEVSALEHTITETSLDDLTHWSQSYFDNWGSLYPFLHTASVLRTLEKISTTPITCIEDFVHPFDLVIVKAIFSISLADRRQSFQSTATNLVPYQLVFTSFDDAIQSVGSSLSTPTSFKALQALIGVQLFLVSMLRHNAAAKLCGVIARMMFQIGLHRCPARYARFDAEEVRVRKSMFWTIYSLDRHLCQVLGLPLGIRDDDLDVCYPDHEKHTADPEADMTGAAMGASRTDLIIASQTPSEHPSALQFLIRHAEIKGRIMELCNKSIAHRPPHMATYTEISTMIQKWQNDYEAYLDEVAHPSRTWTAYQTTVLFVLSRESIITLNRPLLALRENSSLRRSALHKCIAASRAIIQALHKTLLPVRQHKATEDEPSVSSPSSLLWPSFTWKIWQSAFILFLASLEGEVTRASANLFAQQSIEILEHIAFRGSVWPRAIASTIKKMSKKNAKSQRHGNIVAKENKLHDNTYV